MRKFYLKIGLWPFFALLFLAGGLRAQVYNNRLQIPDTLNADTINLTIDVERHSFSPDDTLNPLHDSIQTFAYNIGSSSNNGYLAPTLIWRNHRTKWINVTNNLPTGSENNITTVHWHGAHIPAWTDGGPHQPIAPDSTWRIHFTVKDSACTLWYHPHGLDHTYTQVEMGASGIIIVRDFDDTLRHYLPHRYNVDDFPLIIQDRYFKSTGNGYIIDTTQAGNGNTKTNIVNGIVNPYLNVPPQLVRFRVLDGSGRIAYQLGIGDSAQTPQTFNLIASDGGYLAGPVAVDSFITGPGIRNEIVMDFTGKEGQRFYLLNLAKTLPAGVIGKKNSAQAPLLEFRVQGAVNQPVASIPPAWPPLDSYDINAVDTTRQIKLIGVNCPPGPQPDSCNVPFSINNQQMNPDKVNQIIQLNAIEIWSIENYTPVAHPFHIHDIQFFVLDVHDTLGNLLPTPVEYLGPKDNIMVYSGDVVRFITQFADFATQIAADSTYMFHCHILTHEDGYYGNTNFHMGMMNQFVVTYPSVSSPKPEPLADGMQLYPNPATDEINLLGECKLPSQVRIYDLSGRELMAQDLKPFDGKTTVDVSALPPGMILFEWQNARGRFTRKVVIR
jgi:FtsP/CotA-like multicopper oxidase with cupredoxin domain